MLTGLETVWRRLNTLLHARVGAERYATWIRCARPVTLDDNEFVFHFADDPIREKIETLLRPIVADAARKITNRNIRVRFTAERGSFTRLRSGDTPRSLRPRPRLFSTFIAGRGNRLALDAARDLAQNPKCVYRTLLLHGPAGLGKSHLLEAVGQTLGGVPGRVVLRFTGDQFHRQFLVAHHRGHITGFLKKCRSAAVLLMDDLHLMAGKPETQTAFLNTLLAMGERGGRVMVTSEKSPRQSEGFTRILRGRLRFEMEVALEPPDPTTAIGILRAWAPSGVPAATIDTIARHITSGPGDQLQCLADLLQRGTPTPAAARVVVTEFLNRWSHGLSYEDIARAVAENFGVHVSEIYSSRRTRSTSDARQACFFLARRLLRDPFAQIGRHFGGRDHATVLQACRKLERTEGRSLERLRRLERDLAALQPLK